MATKFLDVINATLTGTTMDCPTGFAFCANPQGYENPYCERDTCGAVNANPTMFLTMSWTNTDCKRTYLGCTFYNGEQKEVYSASYNKGKNIGPFFGLPAPPSTFDAGEDWGAVGAPTFSSVVISSNFAMAGFMSVSLFGGQHLVNAGGIPLNTGSGGIKLHSANTMAVTAGGVSMFSPSPVSSMMFGGPFTPSIGAGPTYALLNFADGYLDNAQFTGFVTFTDGTTLSWMKGNGW